MARFPKWRPVSTGRPLSSDSRSLGVADPLIFAHSETQR